MCIMLSGILACVPGTLNSEMRESFQILVRKGRTTVRNGKHCGSIPLCVVGVWYSVTLVCTHLLREQHPNCGQEMYGVCVCVCVCKCC